MLEMILRMVFYQIFRSKIFYSIILRFKYLIKVYVFIFISVYIYLYFNLPLVKYRDTDKPRCPSSYEIQNRKGYRFRQCQPFFSINF